MKQSHKWSAAVFDPTRWNAQGRGRAPQRSARQQPHSAMTVSSLPQNRGNIDFLARGLLRNVDARCFMSTGFFLLVPSFLSVALSDLRVLVMVVTWGIPCWVAKKFIERFARIRHVEGGTWNEIFCRKNSERNFSKLRPTFSPANFRVIDFQFFSNNI